MNIPAHANIFGMQGAALQLQDAAKALRDASEALFREGVKPPSWLLVQANECDKLAAECEQFVLSTGLVTP